MHTIYLKHIMHTRNIFVNSQLIQSSPFPSSPNGIPSSKSYLMYRRLKKRRIYYGQCCFLFNGWTTIDNNEHHDTRINQTRRGLPVESSTRQYFNNIQDRILWKQTWIMIAEIHSFKEWCKNSVETISRISTFFFWSKNDRIFKTSTN